MKKEEYLETINGLYAQSAELQKQLNELSDKARKLKVEYANANREFLDGDKVTVINGQRKEEGIVVGIEDVNADGTIKYRIAALKKDGTAHASKKVWLWFSYKIIKSEQTVNP